MTIRMFVLRPEDERLIAAAIALGDWLLAHPDITPVQAEGIHTLVAALRRLPHDSPEITHVEYGFSIEPEDRSTGINRSWIVSLWRHPGDAGVLEIFNVYTTLSYGDDLCDAEHESFFYLQAGGDNRYGGDWQELIEEFLQPPPTPSGHTFEIEVEFDHRS